jgi:hypothetical protein
VDAETLPVAAETFDAAVLSQLPAVVWATDRELRFTASTGRALASLGLDVGEAVGRSL